MSSNSLQPLVSVGLPAYNRPELLRQALESLTQQSYKNLEIIISDDCSPGEGTQLVVQEFIEKDARVKCFRQEKNLGPVPNHQFVFEKAKGEFFFWASEDDEWSENYFETGVRSLLSNPDYDAWCCTIRITDNLGRVICNYSGFSRWTSTQKKWKDIVNYLLEPESLGKAHVFHSIFRREALSQTIKEYWFNDNWGTDMCFGIAFLSRFNLIATDEILFNKRDKNAIIPTGDEKLLEPVVIQKPASHSFPLSVSIPYISEYYKAARTTRYKYLVVLIMLMRLLNAIRKNLHFNQTIKLFATKFALKIKNLLLRSREFIFIDLFWRAKFSYERDPMTIDVRWNKVHTTGIIRVPLNILRAPILTPTGMQYMSIEQTPHYPWIKSLVTGSDDACLRNKYRDYLKTYYPEEDTDAGLAQVVALVSSFTSEKRNRDSLITVVTNPPTRYKGANYIVLFDGVHRSAIALSLGHEFIQCRLVSSRINSHDFGFRMK